MHSENHIIDSIVNVLSKEEHVTKVLFFTNSKADEVTLIIYEDCRPNYMIAQGAYEELLKEVANQVTLNILPVNCEDALVRLDSRLEDLQCIYEREVSH